jgi:predicted nucleotidyltransferase
MMRRIEPFLIPVISDLVGGLREVGIDFCVVGALVPELLLDARPGRMTNDADVTVVVESLADFERVKDRLATFGFSRTRLPYRLQHRTGGLLDLLPFSEAIAPNGRLDLGENLVFNMAGFDQVVPNALQVLIDDGITVPLAPLPLYVLLKLVAFSDRKAAKDLAGVFHCLEHYREDDAARYGLDHDGEAVPFEYTCAFLVGFDGRQFHDQRLRETVSVVLDRFDSSDADVVSLVARENGRLLAEDNDRIAIFELFRWFRLGGGL